VRRHLSVKLSAAALFVAALGATSLGSAAVGVVKHALFANNAARVGGLQASTTPKEGQLLALGSNGKFPVSVLPLAAGPAGPAGETGATGPAGPPGPKGAPGNPALPNTITVVSAHLNVSPGATATGTAACPSGYLATGGAVDTVDPATEWVSASSFTLSDGDTAEKLPSGQTTSSAVGWSGTVHDTSATVFDSFTVAVICVQAG
jgi:hypothetical protein